MNGFKTAVFLAALGGLLLFLGQLMGGGTGLVIALGIALALNGGMYWYSAKLAIKMAKAKPASEADYPWYHSLVTNLSQQAGKPVPNLYVSPSPQPNAFATGRSPQHAAVCVNQGLIDLLSRDEMEGVLAHELSHVYNRDILLGTIAATLATAITFLARFLFFFGGNDRGMGPGVQIALMLLAPIAAVLIRAAVTRSRESQADASGAELCGKPMSLASALQKLESGGRSRARQGATPAETSSAFSTLYISPGPMQAGIGGLGGMGKMFRSHPPTEERVRNLEQIARRMGQIA